jgi:hypothetical protein
VDEDTYDVKCCQGALMSQGIGQIESAVRTGGGAFSDGYSDGFDRVQP